MPDTNDDRLDAHIDDRLLSPTDDRKADLEAQVSMATRLPIEITLRGPRAFTFSTEQVAPDLEDRMQAFLGTAVKLETHHDDECGSFCYATV